MASVISGEGLGLYNSSLNILGSATGNARLGSNGDRVYVNSQTGNLILQQQDEFLSSLGLDLSLARTYNALGVFDDGDNGDNWRLNLHRRVHGLSGTVNTAGSTVQKTFGDGFTATYTYDATLGYYVSPDGAGAHDTLSFNAEANTWTWTDGTVGYRETYESDGAGNWRLARTEDADGHATTYIYTGTLLTQVNDASGQTTYLDWSGTNLTQIRVVSQGQTSLTTRYAYDTQNRLSQVIVDLSPEDASIADGQTFTTTYTYDGTSNRLASVTSGDGTTLSFTYDAQGRVASYTDGAGQVTTFSYSVTQTSINQAATSDGSLLNDSQVVGYNLETGQLNTTDTQDYSLNSGALSTTDTQTYALNNGQLATTDTQAYALNSGALATTDQISESLSISTNNASVPQSGIVNNYAWVRSGGSLVTTGGISLATGTASRADNTPTQVRATIYRSDGSYYGTVYTDVGYYSAEAWYAYSNEYGTSYSREYRRPVYTTDEYGNTYQTGWNYGSRTTDGQRWNAVSNWNGQVNLSTGSMPADTYTIVIETRDDAQSSGWPGSYYDYADGTWTRTNTVTATVGTHLQPTTISWPAGTAGLGTTYATIAYRPAGSGAAYTTINANISGGTHTANLGNLAAGNYDYQIRYYNSSNAVVKSSDGTFSVGTGTTSTVSHGFTATISRAPYYRIQGGDTWASIATNLYGSANVADELQSALGNPALTAGSDLTGIPASLTDTFNTAAYYRIQSGDTWASIATALYGTANVADELQSALGNPALTAGTDLTGIPASLTDTFNTAPYYRIQSGQSWADIAEILYGTRNLADELAALPGMPTLQAGNDIVTPPATLTDTFDTPAYYVVQSGQTWDDIALALYGTTNVTAALITSLGGDPQNPPALTAGQRLQGLPSILNNEEIVSPYYTVQSGDTWSIITQRVYGVTAPEAVQALQNYFAGLQPPVTNLTTGMYLTMPTTLNYVTSETNSMVTTVTDPLGYATVYVQDGQGRLAEVRSPAVNGRTLVTTYSYDAQNNVIQARDGNGNATVFYYNADGTVAAQEDAAGQRVEYTYNAGRQVLNTIVYLDPDTDGVGNDRHGAPAVTRNVYDSEGHLRFTVSAEGRVTEHRYNAAGQLLSTLTYRGGVYDLSALAITDTLSDAQLQSWVSGQDLSRTQRVDMAYDFRGQLASTTTYTAVDAAGNGLADGTHSLTLFVYDQRGRLIESVDPRGSQTVNSDDYKTRTDYDGLGRVTRSYVYDETGSLITASHVSGATSITVYDDANNTVTTTLVNGLATTSVYNARGQLVSQSQRAPDATPLGDTTYHYDANGRLRYTDNALGQRTHMIYDEAGRPVATVDAHGALVETVYDDAGNVFSTIAYANRLSATQLSALNTDTVGGFAAHVDLATVRPTQDPLADRKTYTLYDRANRPVLHISATDDNPNQGYVTQSFYDGAGRVTDVIAYANAVDISGITAQTGPADIAITPSADDRHVRSFYSDDGLVLATVDGEGYVSENVYDGAGQLLETIAYAQSAGGSFTSDDWTAIQSRLNRADPANLHSYNFYDAQGRVVGTINTDDYLTTTAYDRAGNAVEVRTYDVAVNYTGAESLAQLIPQNASPAQWQVYTYDALDRVLSETQYARNANSQNINGVPITRTDYEYDVVGNLVRTSFGANTSDVRTVYTQYDAAGRVIAELTPRGAQELANPGSRTEQEIWDQWAIKYTYDQLGRRLYSSGPNGQASWYYYDEAGQLKATITAADNGSDIVNRGEVILSNYNAFGQVIDTTAFANRIDTSTLTGGDFAQIQAVIDAARDGSRDSTTSVNYNLRGAVREALDANGYRTHTIYNAFGETQVVRAENTSSATAGTLVLDGSNSVGSRTVYDRRGIVTDTYEDIDGFNRHARTVTDAFGRVTDVYLNGILQQHVEYGEDAGRQVVTTYDAMGFASTMKYDAYGRTLTAVDKNGLAYTYIYDDETQTVTVRTPAGIETSTRSNAHGETIRVTDGNGVATEYTYDADGNLTRTVVDQAGLNLQATQQYDESGRTILARNATGVATVFRYDAANRLIETIVDPANYTDENGNTVTNADALNIRTTTRYDAKGRAIYTTDANGTLTRTRYDRNGQVTEVQIDPDGLNLRTHYSYDGLGQTLTVIEGYQTAQARKTVYQYDDLGRRTHTIVDPDGLNIVTQYRYDGFDNVVAVIDPENHLTRFIFDANQRQTHAIDAEMGVTVTEYDNNDNVIRTYSYANPVSIADGADQFALTQADLVLTTGASDRITRYAYDDDNRLIYSVNSLGAIGKNIYDANNNLVQQIAYAATLDDANLAALDGFSGAQRLSFISNTIGAANRQQDQISHYYYDAANRLTLSIDAAGYAVQQYYDANGNVIQQTALAQALDLDDLANVSAQVASRLANAANRTVYNVYDSINRLRFNIDAMGYVKEQQYDNIGNIVKAVDYATPIAVTGAPTLAQMAGLLTIEAANRETLFEYDILGRLDWSEDALGNREYFTYDMLGNKKSYTNKNGDIWYYEYDVLGRQVEERTPAVEVTRLVETGGVITPQVSTESIINRTVYDRLGNVIEIWEAVGTPEQRVTYYDFDGVGRQIRTRFPATNIFQGSSAEVGVGGTQSGIVRNYAWVRSGNTLVQTPGGISLQLDSSYYTENTPTSVKATLYRSDGTYYSTIYTDVGYRTEQSWVSVFDENAGVYYYAETDENGISGYKFNNVSNWNGQVNLTFTSLPADVYTIVVEIRDDHAAQFNGQAGTTVDYDGTWVNTQTVTATIGTIHGDPERGDALSTDIYSEVTYDVFGNAVVNRDVAGVYSYKVYDELGRVVYEVDAENYVTEYAYDAFHNQVALTRYADAITLADDRTQPLTAGEVQNLLTAARGNAVSVSNHDAVTHVAPNQPYTYVEEVAASVEDVASEQVGVQVSNTFAPQSSIVNNYAWTRSGTTLTTTGGVSLATGTALYGDTTPTQVKATIYRSDGSYYGTVYTDVGYYSTENWYDHYDEYGGTLVRTSTNSQEPYYATDEYGNTYLAGYYDAQYRGTGNRWIAASNWNGQVNLSTGSMPSGFYRVVIETRDDAVQQGSYNSYYDYTDGTWVRSNEVYVAVGSALETTTLQWSAGNQPQGTTAEVRYRAFGSQNAFITTGTNLSGGTHSAGLTVLNGVQYEYQINYRDANGAVVKSASGVLTGGVNNTFNENFYSRDASATIVSGSSITGYVSSGDVQLLESIEARVYDAETGNLISHAVTIPQAEANYAGRVNLSVGETLSPGRYTISITYHYNSGTTEIRPDFTYEIGAQPVLSRATSLSWSAASQPNGTTVRFSYAPVTTGNYQQAAVSTQNGVHSVALSGLSTGTYSYRIEYLDSASNVVRSETGQFSTQANNVLSSSDRTLYKSYDILNRHTTTIEPVTFNYDPAASVPNTQHYFTAGRTTVNTFNGFGDVVKTSTLRNPLSNEWLDTYFYYDKLGRKTDQVDALGYVTHWEYDQAGNTLREIQYAQALSGGWNESYLPTPAGVSAYDNNPIGYDRETEFVYDKLDRKLSETRVNVVYSTAVYGSTMNTNTVIGSLTTSYTYDAVGNNTSVTDATNVTTRRYFDALGRTTGVTDAGRRVSSGEAYLPPLTIEYTGANAARISWSNIATSTTTINFQYRLQGAANWTTVAVQNDGARQFVNLTGIAVGNYEYQIDYFQQGEAESYLAGSGVLELTGLTAVGSSQLVEFVDEQYLQITPELAYWTSDENGYYWSSTRNRINLAWADLSNWGSGNVTVTVDYVEANGWGQSRTTSRTLTLDAQSGRNGTVLNLDIPANSLYNGYDYRRVAQINNVRVWKEIDGQNVLILQGNTSTMFDKRLVLRGNTAGLSAINIGGSTVGVSNIGADVYVANLSTVNNGAHTYTTQGQTAAQNGDFVLFAGELANSGFVLREHASSLDVNFRTGLDINENDVLNVADIKWGSLAGWGDGQVKVTVDYVNTSGQDPRSITQTFSAMTAEDGASVSWRGAWVGQLTRVRVWKTVGTTEVLINDSSFGIQQSNLNASRYNSSSGQTYGEANASRLYLNGLPANTASISMQYRLVGEENPYRIIDVTNVAANWYAVDYRNLSSGHYEYILTVLDSNGNAIDLSALGGNTDGTLSGNFAISNGADAAPLVDQSRGASLVSPLTTFHYDVYGKAVHQVSYANGVNTADTAVLPTADPDPANDQHTFRFFDSYGRMTREVGPNGAIHEMVYDAHGNVVKEWDVVTDYENSRLNRVTYHVYDRMGREVSTIKNLDAQNMYSVDMRYNAFGEMTGRGENGEYQEIFEYDASGRLWRSNQQDGVWKVYLYNMMDSSTALITSPSRNLGDSQLYRTPSDVALLTTGVRRVENTYDALGRLISESQPWMESETIVAQPQVVRDAITVLGYSSTQTEDGYTASASFAWSSLARFGNGDVRLAFDYTTSQGTYVYSQILSGADTGGSVNFGPAGAVNSISNVRVWKQVDGYEVLVHDNSVANIQTRLTWQSAGAFGGIATLRYRALGTTAWQEIEADIQSNYYWVNLTGLPANTYEYTLSYKLPDSDITYYSTEGMFAVTGTNNTGSSSISAFIDNARATVQSISTGSYATDENGAAVVDENGNASWNYGRVAVAWDTLQEWGDGPVRVQLDYQYHPNGYTTSYSQTYTLGQADGGLTIVVNQGSTTSAPNQVYAVNRVRAWITINGVEVLVRDSAAADTQRLILQGATGGLSGINILGQGGYTVTQIAGHMYAANVGTLANGEYEFVAEGVALTDPITFRVGDPPAQAIETSRVNPTRSQTMDRWGNALAVTDARGYVSEYRYDHNNKAVHVIEPQVAIAATNGSETIDNPEQYFAYDALGRQLQHINTNGYRTGYQYDAAGNKLATYLANNGVERSEYDILGREITRYDANGYRTDMIYDRANNMIEQRRELSTETFTYNELGEKTSQTNGAGERSIFYYDAMGNIIKTRMPEGQESYQTYDQRGNKIKEWWSGTAEYMTWNYSYFNVLQSYRDLAGHTTSFTYNHAGGVTSQTSTRGQNQTLAYYNNGQLKSLTDHAMGTQTLFEYDAMGNKTRETFIRNGQVFTDTKVAYDSHNRIILMDGNRYTLSYSYDAMGNRRSVIARYTNAGGGYDSVENWYLYDSMNRIVLSQGVLVNGAIQINQEQGIELSYDAAGNRATSRSYKEINNSKVLVNEQYVYDAQNRLIQTYRDGGLTSERLYDAADRVTVYKDYKYNQPGVLNERRVTTYNQNGWQMASTIYDGSGGHKASLRYDYEDSYDSRGHLLKYTMYVSGDTSYTNTYVNSYEKFDSYKEKTVYGSSTVLDSGRTDTYYDVNGNITRVHDVHGEGQNDFRYITDSTGQILRKYAVGAENKRAFDSLRWQNTGAKPKASIYDYFYFNGKTIGSYNDIGDADFDFNYTPVNGQYPSSTPNKYVVNPGDTLRSIALAVYGDAAMWFLIADANGLTSDADLREGIQLTIPNQVSNFHNTSETFKPYNPAEIIGSTTPTLPVPEPDKCAVFIVRVITLVVYAVVLYFSGGNAVLASVVSNVVGQIVGNILGVQDGFDWGSVAIAAIAAYVGSQAGAAAGPAGSTANVVTTAVVSNVVTQGLNVATGRQDKFDWKQVAIAAITAYIGSQIDAEFANSGSQQEISIAPDANPQFDWARATGEFIRQLPKEFIKGVINQVIKKAFYKEGKFDWYEVAADAFGNSIANSISKEGQIHKIQKELAEIEAAIQSITFIDKGIQESRSREDRTGFIRVSAGGSTKQEYAIPVTFGSEEERNAYIKRYEEINADSTQRLYLGLALRNDPELYKFYITQLLENPDNQHLKRIFSVGFDGEESWTLNDWMGKHDAVTKQIIQLASNGRSLSNYALYGANSTNIAHNEFSNVHPDALKLIGSGDWANAKFWDIGNDGVRFIAGQAWELVVKSGLYSKDQLNSINDQINNLPNILRNALGVWEWQARQIFPAIDAAESTLEGVNALYLVNKIKEMGTPSIHNAAVRELLEKSITLAVKSVKRVEGIVLNKIKKVPGLKNRLDGAGGNLNGHVLEVVAEYIIRESGVFKEVSGLDFSSIKNNSGWGIDIIGITHTNEVVPIEVKGTKGFTVPDINAEQAKGADSYMRYQIERAKAAMKHWSKTDMETVEGDDIQVWKRAKMLEKMHRQGGSDKYKGYVLHISNYGDKKVDTKFHPWTPTIKQDIRDYFKIKGFRNKSIGRVA